MKQIKINKLIIAVTMVFCSSTILKADGWGEIRTKYEAGCLDNLNYTAFASLKCNFIDGWRTKSQNLCSPHCAEKEIGIGSSSNQRAYQKTKFGKYCGLSSEGFTTKKRCYRGCSDFDIINYLGLQVTSDDTSEGPAASESNKISISNVTINKSLHSILLSGIFGYERINTANYTGSFKIVVWLTNDDNDSILTSVKTLWTAEVKLENGVITYNNFTNSEVTLSSTDSGYVMMLNNFNKLIQLSTSVNMDRIAVRIITHQEESLASSLPNLLSNNTIVSSDIENTLIIKPTMVEDVINIELKSENVETDYNGSNILIFNEQGKEVYNSNNTLEISSNSILIKNIQLSQGIYYLILCTKENKKYVNKFIKL